MAKSRRRKRRAQPGRSAADLPRREPAAPPARRRAPEGRPPAPWGSFPLVELMVLAGIVLLVWGAVTTEIGVLAAGLGLASLGGLELSVREHFGGYRSHTTLLAGTAAVLTIALTFAFSGLVLAACLALGAAVFAVGVWLLRRVFRRASGGLSYRVGRVRG